MPISDSNINKNQDSDSGSSTDSGGQSGNSIRKPLLLRGHLVQAELGRGEKKFGEVDWSRRDTEPPPEEQANDLNHSEEADLAAANDDVVEPHPWLTCQQFDGRDPQRDPRIPSAADIINYADNNPQAQLTLNPQLRLALENAKRNRMSATPSLKPAGM